MLQMWPFFPSDPPIAKNGEGLLELSERRALEFRFRLELFPPRVRQRFGSFQYATNGSILSSRQILVFYSSRLMSGRARLGTNAVGPAKSIDVLFRN